MITPRYTTLGATLGAADYRIATLQERAYMIVPVVALVGDAVVRPMGSDGPEFVPADELARVPASWNGRPTVSDHPAGGSGSANEIEILESDVFGQMLNTRYEDGRLKTEAWIDVARAEKLGGDPMLVVERLRAGEPIEVSVGAWVTAEKRSGTSPSGKPYEYVWHDIVPDHLALLPADAQGACSREMGCGVRAAKEMRMTLFERLTAALKGYRAQPRGWRLAQEDVSDVDIRRALDTALYAEEPGYLGIDAVYAETSEVVYAVAPDGEVKLYRRGYEMGDEGAVLATEKVEVQLVTEYKPVAASAADCGCKQTGHAAHNEGEPRMKEKIQQMVSRLIACERSPFTEADAERLGGFGEEALVALAKSFEPPTDPPKPQPAADPNVVSLSKAEHARLVRAAEREEAREAAERDRLIAKIAEAESDFTEDELRAMSVEQIAKIAKLAGAKDEEPADFSAARGLGLPPKGAERFVQTPDSYGLSKETN